MVRMRSQSDDSDLPVFGGERAISDNANLTVSRSQSADEVSRDYPHFPGNET